jgi:hypothetical protein
MDVSSGAEIAAWFREEHTHKLSSFQGCDGLSLTRDGSDYCYVWLEAYVDMDMVGYFLLDVRTNTGNRESRDFLLVWDGAERGHEWHQHPIEFGAPPEAHRDRMHAGLVWMADRILLSSEG